MEHVALGLSYMHDVQPLPVIHRDLKPKNILLFHNRTIAKLTDFGLTRVMRTNMTNNVGTSSYLAPEVSITPTIVCV
jgi:mitogen-activated protein kinase kinase kinase 7